MSQKTPETTIIVYSKSGHSRRAAEYLGTLLGCVPLEVRTQRYSWPVLGWIAAGRDEMQGRAAPLRQTPTIADAGLALLVGPVWAGGPAGPLNTVIDILTGGHQDVAALLTSGDPKEETTPLDRIAARLGRPLLAGMVLSNAAQETPEGQARMREFAARLGPTGPAT